MNELQRTLAFVAVAVVSVVAARFAGPSTPKQTAAITGVGEVFYPDFKDADAAKSLQVSSYNAETAEVRPFSVVQGKDGLWRIPTRNNYPADGQERLAKTATSMIGIKREGFAGPRDNEHAEFGVLDPQGDSHSDLKGIGNRITLKDEAGKVLADYIIGKEVKGRPGNFYIRRPDEKATYFAKLDIQVSTKFADWIEPDLLKLDATRLSDIVIDTSSVDLSQGAVVEGETSKLSRKVSSDPWKLAGLDEAAEEVNQDEINKLIKSLDDLKIVGVRQKPAKLMQGLREGKLQRDQFSALDLQDKGFFLATDRKSNRTLLVPKEGQMIAITNQGVAYDLKFGDIFSGNEQEVEAGFAAKEGDAEKKTGEEQKKDEESKEADKQPESDKPKLKSRYLFVMVHFDEAGLGTKPEAPVKPEPPADPAADVADDTEASADASAPLNKAEDPKKVYESAVAKFEADQKRYEADSKAFEQKVKDGEKLVKELNSRFADWYYVVSGESFENLRQGKKTLVKAKVAATETPADPAGTPPATPPVN
ncbi:MAG: DUF4340 domain-containing protein [Planctomycetales bacterium]|nr:DUF4340 domain-containing protein [Planctomycetales bacterium]